MNEIPINIYDKFFMELDLFCTREKIYEDIYEE